VNCSEVVDAALELSSPLIEQREHKLVLKRPEGTVWINGDFERMTQAVSNLLNNAARYSEVGATITVSAGKAAGLAYFRVTDTGLGFAPDVAESLFDMFARVPQHKKYTGGGGLGVGLPLARQLVELHGGTIVAKSDGPGKGSTFEVRIPLAAEDIEAVVNVAGPDSDDRRSTLPAADTSSRRILVVDDNVDAAEAMSLLLEKHNHVVRIAHDGESAIKMVGDFEPQAVLLDIGLPGTDGYDVASAIRQMPIGQSIRLIALTGWGQAHDKRLAKKAGFDEHLTKPASMQRVLELIVDKHQH
jgi:CheY-like chemotaxis protein